MIQKNNKTAVKSILKGTVVGYDINPLKPYERANFELSGDVVAVINRVKKDEIITVFNATTNEDVVVGKVKDFNVGTFGGITVNFHSKGRWGKDYQLYVNRDVNGPFELKMYQ
jgi:hypothetical protein